MSRKLCKDLHPKSPKLAQVLLQKLHMESCRLSVSMLNEYISSSHRPALVKNKRLLGTTLYSHKSSTLFSLKFDFLCRLRVVQNIHVIKFYFWAFKGIMVTLGGIVLAPELSRVKKNTSEYIDKIGAGFTP